MKQKPSNPFLVQGYYSPEYFCDRERESKAILKALGNDRNISLISPRRMGKTGLIKHIFHLVTEERQDVNCFYFDIFPSRNLNDFCSIFAQAVIGKLDSRVEALFKKISSLFKNIRFSLSYDSVSGEPKITCEVASGSEQYALEEIFSYLEKSDKRCYIAIDEFQQIVDYPERNVEALLRSHIQFLQNVHFIFSGSKRTLMEAIFSDSARPFYQSTQKISLGIIDINAYRSFASQFFTSTGRTLPDEIFDSLYKKVNGHTWYVQYILNELYASPEISTITEKDIDTAIAEYNAEERATFQTYCDSLTDGQLLLLQAIAQEKTVSEPTSQIFIRKYSLPASSSIQRSLTSLIAKSLILKNDENQYIVYNQFFRIWLKNHNM